MNACLEYLLDRTGLLSAHVESAKAHLATGAALSAAAQSELATQISPAKKPPKRATTASPTPRRKSSSSHSRTGTSPVYTRSNLSSLRRRSSGADLPPLEQLYQLLALPPPPAPQDDTTTFTTTAATASLALDAALAERIERAADAARAAQEAFDSAASTQLADARRAVRLARNEVLAESPFGEVRLVDPGIESSIGVLAQEVGKVAAQVEEMRKEVGKGKAGSISGKREILVGRWGG